MPRCMAHHTKYRPQIAHLVLFVPSCTLDPRRETCGPLTIIPTSLNTPSRDGSIPLARVLSVHPHLTPLPYVCRVYAYSRGSTEAPSVLFEHDTTHTLLMLYTAKLSFLPDLPGPKTDLWSPLVSRQASSHVSINASPAKDAHSAPLSRWACVEKGQPLVSFLLEPCNGFDRIPQGS